MIWVLNMIKYTSKQRAHIIFSKNCSFYKIILKVRILSNTASMKHLFCWVTNVNILRLPHQRISSHRFTVFSVRPLSISSFENLFCWKRLRSMAWTVEKKTHRGLKHIAAMEAASVRNELLNKLLSVFHLESRQIRLESDRLIKRFNKNV